MGSKFFLVKEKMIWLMERKFWGLKMADVMCLAYQLAVRNGIKN